MTVDVPEGWDGFYSAVWGEDASELLDMYGIPGKVSNTLTFKVDSFNPESAIWFGVKFSFQCHIFQLFFPFIHFKFIFFANSLAQ